MNRNALQDIQKALNVIRAEAERVDDETRWAALELMLGTSNSVVALARKMTKPEKKTKTTKRTVPVPKTKPVKPKLQQQKTSPKDKERKDFSPIRPQPPLPNQQADRKNR